VETRADSSCPGRVRSRRDVGGPDRPCGLARQDCSDQLATCKDFGDDVIASESYWVGTVALSDLERRRSNSSGPGRWRPTQPRQYDPSQSDTAAV
jgi:hypothetical protein